MRLLVLMAASLFLAMPALAQTPTPVVEDAWVMTSLPGATEAAAYLVVRNVGGDRLLSVACDCAARAELHEMRVVDGVMQMRPLRYGLASDANGAIRLSPSGAHAMLIGLAAPMTEGESVTMRLTFRDAGVVCARAQVRRR